ncbi:hypothetical protein [Arthrobacter sp. A5]
MLELPQALASEERLRCCAAVFDSYAERVYAVLHAPVDSVMPGTGE